MWIVMTACAKMPSKVRAPYRRVALVQLTQEYTSHFLLPGYQPKMISERARGVLRIVDMGHHFVGKSDKCAFRRVFAEAQRRATALNQAMPLATDDLLVSWGGSA